MTLVHSEHLEKINVQPGKLSKMVIVLIEAQQYHKGDDKGKYSRNPYPPTQVIPGTPVHSHTGSRALAPFIDFLRRCQSGTSCVNIITQYEGEIECSTQTDE